MKRKLLGNFGLTLFILMAAMCAAVISACSLFDNLGGKKEEVHSHSLSHTEKKDATCTEDGNIEYWHCADCGKYFSDALANAEISGSSILVPASHTLEYMYYIDATCIYSGHKTYYKCEVCDETFWDENGQEPMNPADAEIPPTGIHTWNDNYCTVCKIDGGGTKKLQWTLIEGGYSVTGIGNCQDEDIVLPSTYNGEPVIKIGDNAFFDCYSFNSITIPDSVTEIGEYAFFRCGVKEITFGSGIEKIGYNAFSQCFKVEKINVKEFADWCSISFDAYGNPLLAADALLYIDGEPIQDGFIIPENITAIPDYTFKNIPLTNIIIPDSVQSIGTGAFAYCYTLKKLQLPFACGLSSLFSTSATWIEEVVITGGDSIPDEAFYYCMALTKLTLPQSISSVGEKAFYKCEKLESLTLPNVLVIGSNAFSGCTLLESLALSDSLISIGAGAFNGCENLVSVPIPSTLKSIGDNTFNGCKKLENITLPAVTSIGANAFSGCEKLLSLTIPETVKSIGNNAFSGCTNLEEVYFNAVSCTMPNLLNAAFNDCSALTTVVIGESVVSIPNYAFARRTSIKNVTIKGDIVSIGDYAFYYCQIEEITLPDSLTTIGEYAFNNNRLQILSIPSDVTQMGEYAFGNSAKLETVYWNATECTNTGTGTYSLFNNCKELKTVILSENVISIPDYCFGGCTSLTDVTFSDNLIRIGMAAFKGCTSLTDVTFFENLSSIGSEAFKDCTGLKNIAIPAKVTGIYEGTFSGCTGLEGITIPKQVQTIGANAFSGCVNLADITIPDFVSTIGANAFFGCESITSVTIPFYVSTIGDSAFSGCISLESVYWNAENCYYAGSENKLIFANCPLLSTLVFGNRVWNIPNFAFAGCSITGVIIPASIENIGEGAFYGCTSLASAIFENPNGWYYARSTNTSQNPLSVSMVSNAQTMADRLTLYKTDRFYRTLD